MHCQVFGSVQGDTDWLLKEDGPPPPVGSEHIHAWLTQLSKLGDGVLKRSRVRLAAEGWHLVPVHFDSLNLEFSCILMYFHVFSSENNRMAGIFSPWNPGSFRVWPSNQATR